MSQDELPPGYAYVNVRTFSLEMLRNEAPDPPAFPEPWELIRWPRPALDDYRALFLAVGGDWGWTGRALMPDAELAELLSDDRIEIWRLVAGSDVAGFVELDRRIPGEAEIVYFGLAPEFIGRGMGSVMLRQTIDHVWTTTAAGDSTPTRRLWLHTCDFDHPGALSVYQKAGFRVFAESEGPEAYPQAHIAGRAASAIDRTSGPHAGS